MKKFFLKFKNEFKMSRIVQNINELRSQIPNGVKIVAISKNQKIEKILEAMEAGQKIFGESKVQELDIKQKQIPEAQWHMVGHLQTNKVKQIVSFVSMIQSVDSLRLLVEIDKQASKYNRVIDCLLQIHIAREETKFGFSQQEIIELLEAGAIQSLLHVRICGLMGMATYTDDTEAVRSEFRGLADFFKSLRKNFYSDELSFCELSMGMSDDYTIAIEEGATIIRPGSIIFENFK